MHVRSVGIEMFLKMLFFHNSRTFPKLEMSPSQQWRFHWFPFHFSHYFENIVAIVLIVLDLFSFSHQHLSRLRALAILTAFFVPLFRRWYLALISVNISSHTWLPPLGTYHQQIFSCENQLSPLLHYFLHSWTFHKYHLCQLIRLSASEVLKYRFR